MAPHGLRDLDRLDGLSNFSVWKARILIILEAYNLRDHAEQTLATPTDVDLLRKHKEAAGHAKRLIMDGIKDHIVPHVAEKKTTKEMWKALVSLYEEKSFQRKMLLETQMRSLMMTKGEDMEHFLFRLSSIRDQLTTTGAMVDDAVIVRTAFNAVTDEWETFFQSILGRADLLDWDSLWSILRQEELRRFTKKQYSSRSSKVKKEDEEDAALASKRHPKKKKDLLKIKSFQCGEMGHFASNCPQKKKEKEASSSKVAMEDVGSEDDSAMSTHEPQKWGNMDL